MKTKLVAMLAALAALVAVSSALAATIGGTSGDDRLPGTMAADEIRAYAGNDFVNARAGDRRSSR